MPSREYYLNSDFDLGLRGRSSLLESPDATFVHEMAWHFLFAGGSGDSVIVHRPLPADFQEYLSGKGVALPRQVLHPAFTREAEFTPFGWDAHADGLSRRYDNPPDHPDPAAVKRANSRAFSLELEREWADPASPSGYGTLFETMDGLEGHLRSRAEAEGWVIKGEHGHAAIANRRVPSGALSGEDRTALERLMREHGRVVAEPWDDRLLDLSVNFTVERGGGLSGIRGHQLLNSRDGAFLGVQILPSGLPPDPWGPQLFACAGAVARALDALGYFGPAGIDAYVHRAPEGPRLRPLVEINARRSMALPVHGLAARLPGRTLLWMWSKPRKLELPADYRSLDERLGRAAFRADTGTGILAVSPIRLESGSNPAGSGSPDAKEGEPGSGSSRPGAPRPKRIGFLFSASGEAELHALRTAFTAALGRNRCT